MSNSNIKVIAIIATIVLVFTLITSNAVSVASVIFLAKGTTQTGTVADTNNDANVNTNNGASNNTNTPANNGGNTAATQTPSGNTAATQAPAGNNNSGSTATTAPAGNNNGGAAAQSKSNEEVLKIYTDLMNKAKADKPGYKKVEYQELPGDAANRQISKGEGLVGVLLKLVTDTLDLLTTKEEAEADPEIVEKGGDMRWFPVYKCEKGCYLTDVNAIESTKYEDLGNGKARITIVLKDENNPEPMAEGATTSPSNTGAMFSPLSKADIDNTINGGAVQAVIKNVTYSLVYHDCKAVVEYDTNTNQIIRLEQYMNVAIQGGGKLVLLGEIKIDKQELFNTMIISDFQY